LLLLADAEFEMKKYKDSKSHYEKLLNIIKKSEDEIGITESDCFYGIGRC
jgi:hypothetical protein